MYRETTTEAPTHSKPSPVHGIPVWHVVALARAGTSGVVRID